MASKPKKARIKNSGKAFICDFCDSSFPNLRKLNIHRNRPNSHRFRCLRCPKKFVFRKKLTMHIQNAHLSYFGKADKAFRAAKAIVAETREIADSTKKFFPFLCEFCLKRFSNKSELDRHTDTHTGHKQFKCDMCPKSFSQESNLNRHRNVHMGVKPHVCAKCKVAYTDKSSLYKHQAKGDCALRYSSGFFPLEKMSLEQRETNDLFSEKTFTSDFCSYWASLRHFYD
ncbi:hypothetical protein MHBO_002361 [Bonamia ostreae]|uniref:C2H2-type domain-containing protein n=1 Tax=Bonamia ostreae TaxID=126728 RepID=A0ABV2AM34_9EUKA